MPTYIRSIRRQSKRLGKKAARTSACGSISSSKSPPFGQKKRPGTSRKICAADGSRQWQKNKGSRLTAWPSVCQIFKLSTRCQTAESNGKIWNFSPRTTANKAFEARHKQVSRFMRGPAKRTAFVARFVIRGSFARYSSYEHHSLSIRRPAASRIHETRK